MCVTSHSNSKQGLLTCCSFLFCCSFGQGLFEGVYGFHPDILGGYLCVLSIVFLLFSELYASDSIGSTTAPAQLYSKLAIVTLFLAMSVKEEFALIVAGMMFITLLFKRNTMYLKLFAFACTFVAGSFLLISESQTIYNRSNSLLTDNFISTLTSDLTALTPFFSSNVFFLLVILSISFILIIILSKKIEPLILALFCGGAVKLLSSILVNDYHLATWHNFPAIVMLTGSIALQYGLMLQEKKKRFITPFLLLGVAITLINQVPYLFNTGIRLIHTDVTEKRKSILEIKQKSHPEDLTAIPLYSVVE